MNEIDFNPTKNLDIITLRPVDIHSNNIREIQMGILFKEIIP